jgi:hypothetical protein
MKRLLSLTAFLAVSLISTSPSLAGGDTCQWGSFADPDCQIVINDTKDDAGRLKDCFRRLDNEYNKVSNPGKGPEYMTIKTECRAIAQRILDAADGALFKPGAKTGPKKALKALANW